MNGHGKNTLTLLTASLLAAALLGTLVIWTMNLAPRFKTRMGRKAAIAPMIKEAKELNITYESALAAPTKAVGKPALWCLRKGTGDLSYYNGNEQQTVHITNQRRMPQNGSTHQSCTEALLTITTVTAASFGSFSAVRINAEFIGYP